MLYDFAGLYGLWQFYEITGDKAVLQICLDWFRDRFAIGTSKVSKTLCSTLRAYTDDLYEIKQNVNTMSSFLTAAYVHDAGLANYAVHLDSWAEWLMNDMPRTEEGGLQHITYLDENYQQLWDDTLMMSVLPLTKIGLILGRSEYVEEAKRQFILQ